MFNESILPKNKYAHLSKEEAYKVMTVQEMLMDEDVPPDLIVEKLKEVKVNYVSPDADLSQT